MWNMNSEWAIKKAGVRPLIWTDAGFRNLTNSKRPIKKLGDLKGLRIRIPPNPVFVAAFKAFGIDPVTLSWSETFNALQQGVVDGQENCYSAVQTESFYESQKYATDIQWLYTVSHFSISEKYFQSLPAAVQEKIIQAGKDATAWERKKMDEMETEIVQFLKDKRMEFYGVPDDYESWIKAGQSVWPQFYSMIGDGSEAEGKAVIDRVMASK
jgi:TRAP-type C4-dicarboxylate transport system substrate-binding protein